MLYRWRFLIVSSILCLGVAGLLWRVIDLMIVDRGFLLNQGDARSLRIINTPAYRGIITDRNGEPLAVSVPVDAVWIDPQTFAPSDEQLQSLSHLLKLSPSDIQKLAHQNSEREFIYLARGITPTIGEKIKALAIPGLFLKQEFRRYYPEGEVAAQLVGFDNIDDQGQEGIELGYNAWLQGQPGKKRVLIDRLGQIVEELDLLRSPKPGNNLVLSIDRRLQYLAYSVLREAVQNDKARSGSVIILNAKTGEVLAMANVPSYNPNNRTKVHDSRLRNRGMTDTFEPGSTLKAFSVANALASGKYTPNTLINTRGGRMVVEGKIVRDEKDYGELDVTGVLQHSSNVGVTRMTLSLPPETLYNLLHVAGFGARTDTGFPGEAPGFLQDRKVWHPFTLATLSFGYGIAVTSLQLVQGYSILAEAGIKRPITLLRSDKVSPGQQVMDPKIAQEVVTMMESVVEKGGTATRAKVPGYSISGKTGTARMVGRYGYEKNHHTAVFVGIAPVSHPELIVSVVIEDPSAGQYYGGEVSSPIFSKVMGGALRILDIPPDQTLATNETSSHEIKTHK